MRIVANSIAIGLAVFSIVMAIVAIAVAVSA